MEYPGLPNANGPKAVVVDLSVERALRRARHDGGRENIIGEVERLRGCVLKARGLESLDKEDGGVLLEVVPRKRRERSKTARCCIDELSRQLERDKVPGIRELHLKKRQVLKNIVSTFFKEVCSKTHRLKAFSAL